MSPFELPAATSGRRPIRLQIRTGLTGPSSKRPLGLVDDVAAVLVLQVAERTRAADHALGRDPVDRLGDRPHEVAVATRGDVGRETVRLEVAEQLAPSAGSHSPGTPVPASGAAVVQELVRGDRVLLHGHPVERLQEPAEQHLHVAVVAVIVLGDNLTQPRIVALVARPSTAADPSARVLLGHLGQPLEHETQLDRHRFLTPQRAVVVEHGNTLGARHILLAALVGDAFDEVGDRRFGAPSFQERGHS